MESIHLCYHAVVLAKQGLREEHFAHEFRKGHSVQNELLTQGGIMRPIPHFETLLHPLWVKVRNLKCLEYNGLKVNAVYGPYWT